MIRGISMIKQWFRIPSTYLALTIFFCMGLLIYFYSKYGEGFAQDFFSNLLATYIGVIFGVSIGIWVSGYQENQLERIRKGRVLSLLQEELDHNYKELLKWREAGRGGDIEVGNIGTNLRYETWRAFSEGGELEWIKDANILYVLSIAYFQIGAVKTLSEKYFDMIPYRQKLGVDLDNHKKILFSKSDQAENDILEAKKYILQK